MRYGVAGTVERIVGALPGLVAPEEAVDLDPVIALEREGFFDTLMGAKNVHPQNAA